MNKIKKLVRCINVYFIFTLTYFISGFIVNFLQIILHLTVKKFNIKLFRKLNYYLSYTFHSHIIYLAQWHANLTINLYIDKNDQKYLGKEHAYVISNHKYEIDWIILGILAEKHHCIGNYKAYMKKVLQYIPAIGWCLYLSENIFLDRSFEKDKHIIQKQISKLVDYSDPIWLILFPEGTRFTPVKYEVSLKICKEKGLPQLKNLLTPRTKGFVVSLPPMKSKVGAIYDTIITFRPNEKHGTTENTFNGENMEAHVYMKRIPFENVPKDEKGATQFLQDLFIQKDKLQESFLQTGDYFSTSGVKQVSKIKLKRKWITLINYLFWVLLIMGFISYNLIKLLFTGSVYKFCLVSGFLFLFSFGLFKLFETNKTTRGSSYGADTKILK